LEVKLLAFLAQPLSMQDQPWALKVQF
jgi:hypothetical protein